MAQPPSRFSSNKIGQTSLGSRFRAEADPASTGVSTARGQATTYFTKVPVVGETTAVIYDADRMWARITLTLETAGPVAVGFLSGITPVLSGKGQLLATGVPTIFDIPKGAKLYIAATAVNRVKLSVQPLPWLEQIVAYIEKAIAVFVKAK